LIYYWPIRPQAFLLLALYLIFRSTLDFFAADEASSYSAVAILLIRIFLAVTVGLCCTALFTVLFAFLFNFWKRHRLPEVELEQVNSRTSKFSIQSFILPLLGNIRVQLYLNGRQATVNTNFSTEGMLTFYMNGHLNWEVALVDLYRVNAIVIYHSDFLGLLQLPIRLSLQTTHVKWPEVSEILPKKAPISETLSEKFRVEEQKKIEGEYLQYKSFEQGDDIRRIVWNIYARNRELVVRQPELKNPYVSHINFIPVFKTEDLRWIPEAIQQNFLSEFKTKLWQYYSEFSASGIDVRLTRTDHPSNFLLDKMAIRHAITESFWEIDDQQKTQTKKRLNAVFLINPFLPDRWLDEILAVPDVNLIYFSFASLELNKRSWMERLFLKDNHPIRSKWKGWYLSPFYRNLIEREKSRLQRMKKLSNVTIV